jgi:hypothetical protein
MPDTTTAAKKTVEVGKEQILDQRLRIVRQRDLIARHERDRYPNLVADAYPYLAKWNGHSLKWRPIIPRRMSI